MSAASELWTAVVNRYNSDGLVTLTNIRDKTANTINPTTGQAAAQAVINLWPQYAQETYDSTDDAQVEIGTMGVIAVLWRWGGVSTRIQQIKWDEVFGDDGLIARYRRTNARARISPSSNSGVTQATEQASDGGNVRGWADRESLPQGVMPKRRSVSQDD
jgi:hypothetical protein